VPSHQQQPLPKIQLEIEGALHEHGHQLPFIQVMLHGSDGPVTDPDHRETLFPVIEISLKDVLIQAQHQTAAPGANGRLIIQGADPQV
jgi:hypothetical protein